MYNSNQTEQALAGWMEANPGTRDRAAGAVNGAKVVATAKRAKAGKKPSSAVAEATMGGELAPKKRVSGDAGAQKDTSEGDDGVAGAILRGAALAEFQQKCVLHAMAFPKVSFSISAPGRRFGTFFAA